MKKDVGPRRSKGASLWLKAALLSALAGAGAGPVLMALFMACPWMGLDACMFGAIHGIAFSPWLSMLALAFLTPTVRNGLLARANARRTKRPRKTSEKERRYMELP